MVAAVQPLTVDSALALDRGAALRRCPCDRQRAGLPSRQNASSPAESTRPTNNPSWDCLQRQVHLFHSVASVVDLSHLRNKV